MSPPDAVPGALAEPRRRVGPFWVSLLALSHLGLWVGYFGPLQVLLPVQAETVSPASKTAFLGVVTAIGAVVAVVVNPLAGALSDRTTSRWGRRRPWALVGALAGAGGLILLSGQTTLAGVVLGWCLAQGGLNVLQASTTASIPDQVPVLQRATVAGWVAAPQTIGVVVGVVLVTVVVTGTGAGYLAIAAVVLLLTLPYVLFLPDPRLRPDQVPAWSWRAFLRGFWIDPRAHPDFAWAFGTRFLIQLGGAMGTLYLLYYLRDAVRYETTVGGRSEDGLRTCVLLFTTAAVLATVIGGVISDRTGRRRRAVTTAGLVMAVPAVMLALWPTWPVALVAATLLGAGFGVYLSVDHALVTQVLPAAADRGRDLGIINIANSASQVLGPALAAPLVSYLGGYRTLYLTVAAITVLGAVLVRNIRGVP